MNDLQKVYEKVDYGEGYGHTRVGLKVNNRIIWFGYLDSGDNEKVNEFTKMDSLVDEIVEKCS